MQRLPRRPRRKALKSMDKSVLATLKKLGLSEVAKRVRISAAWAQAVGADIAARTEPQSLHRGLLIVRSTSAAWQNELTFLKAEILLKLNAALGKERAVRDLRVVGGSLRSRPPPSDRPKWLDEAPTGDDLDVARDASRPLVDSDLKASFERIVLLDRRARRARPTR
jgi:predicted nucleic acid-binding Zn ribbon protein